MKPLGLILAGVGAILGALAWGLISWSTSYEIGIIAWGIGLLVGVCGLVGGSDGVAGGVACAILALASIGLGKYLGVSWVISGLTSSLSLQSCSKTP